MKKLIEGFSTQLRTALEIASQSQFSPSDKSFTNIVIAGMGGSGIGGNLVQAMTMDITSVPLYISKSYDLPSFVSSSTLFLACSYSGGTEETIATTLAAHAKGATIVCVSSGGKVGELAKSPFDFKDRYVVVALTRQSEEGKPTVAEFRDQLAAEVRKQVKAEQIIAKINGAKTLEEMKAKYGDAAILNSAPDITLASTSMPDVGYDPIAVGRLFGLKQGATTAPFAAETGVVALMSEKSTPAPKIADYTSYKTSIQQRRAGPVTYYLTEAVKELKGVKDDRIQIQ